MCGYILLLTTLLVVYGVKNENVRGVLHRENDCQANGSVLRCQHHIPAKIPRGITEVYIEDLLTTYEEFKRVHHLLRHSTWRLIKMLDIIVNNKAHIEIYNQTFTHLRQLKSLGLHIKTLSIIHPKAFDGMYNLESLDFSRCSYLDISDIITALNKSVLPNLRALNLKEVGLSQGPFLKLNEEFNNVVNTYQIEWLCLSGTNVFLTVKNITWPFRYLDISYTTIHAVDLLRNFDKAFPNLDKLNMSRIPIRFLGGTDQHTRTDTNKIITPKICTLLTRIRFTMLDISYLMSQSEHNYNNCTFNLTSCSILSEIQTFVFKGSNIKSLNSTFIGPKGVKLKSLDLSFNKIEYVSPTVIMDQLRFLQYLFLEDNCLNKMEHEAEFGYLLNKFTRLLELNLAVNKLTHIPHAMFVKNSRLLILDLHGNYLETITFNIRHLNKLEKLDLSGNKIKYIDDNVLTELSLIEISTGKDLTIIFHRNPLICVCENVNFLSWLLKTDMVHNIHGLYCLMNDDYVAINDRVINMSKYLCYRDKLFIILYSISSFFVICIIITIICAILKVRKKKQREGLINFIESFKNNKLEQRYLAFLSHHNNDEDIINENIFQKLNETLQLRFGVKDRDVICVGDRHFQPGMSIFTEIMRCITESCLVICVVSQSFCGSEWCRMEVREACAQAKPIILVFKEQVDTKQMPNYLRTIFERQVRVKLEHRDAEYILVPNLQTVCDSIIQLAYEDYKLKLEA